MKEKLQLDNFEKYLERKKQLVIKEYDSLFTLFGRQTTIIHNYRTWTIGLITAYITLFYSKIQITI